MAISVASVAVMLEMEGKLCQKARVALGAVGPTPIRAYRVEKNLEGRELDQAIIEECSAVVQEEISPIDDIRSPAEYRRLVTSVLLKRGINEALKGVDT
jgi:carbon-monoxide dehydrogenase medium subunit